MDVTTLSDTELTSLEADVKAELIRRQNVAVVEKELADLQKRHRDNGVTTTPQEGGAWKQPTGAHDAYALGDTVTANSKTWVSLIAFNVWAPGTSGWREVPKGNTPAAWAQPTGGHDAYKKGDTVTFEDATWVSIIDGNVWSPTAYPQGWQKQ